MSETLQIIYRDDWMVAMNKPSGLFVHRTALDRREKRAALQLLRDQIGCRLYPVHRLDRPTSGVLLFALDPETGRLMAGLFSTGQCKKRYLAVVRGYLDDCGIVDRPIKKMKSGKRQRSGERYEKISARTCFRNRATIEVPYQVDRYPTSRYSLAELIPETGRRHQLRQHMKQIAHPIIGDTAYCKSTHNRFFQQRFNINRLLLAAFELSFIHPVTHEVISIVATMDEDFRTIIRAFQWENFLPCALKNR